MEERKAAIMLAADRGLFRTKRRGVRTNPLVQQYITTKRYQSIEY